MYLISFIFKYILIIGFQNNEIEISFESNENDTDELDGENFSEKLIASGQAKAQTQFNFGAPNSSLSQLTQNDQHLNFGNKNTSNGNQSNAWKRGLDGKYPGMISGEQFSSLLKNEQKLKQCENSSFEATIWQNLNKIAKNQDQMFDTIKVEKESKVPALVLQTGKY